MLLDQRLAGVTDLITTDAGTNFTADEIKKAASSMGTIIKDVSTEAHNRVGKVERNHGILRSFYQKLKMDLPTMGRADRLSMTLRANNGAPTLSAGISLTILVF